MCDLTTSTWHRKSAESKHQNIYLQFSKCVSISIPFREIDSFFSTSPTLCIHPLHVVHYGLCRMHAWMNAWWSMHSLAYTLLKRWRELRGSRVKLSESTELQQQGMMSFPEAYGLTNRPIFHVTCVCVRVVSQIVVLGQGCEGCVRAFISRERNKKHHQ